MLMMNDKPCTLPDVNMALHQAARNVLLEDDQLMQKFTFVVDPRFIEKKDTLGRNSECNVYIHVARFFQLHFKMGACHFHCPIIGIKYKFIIIALNSIKVCTNKTHK